LHLNKDKMQVRYYYNKTDCAMALWPYYLDSSAGANPALTNIEFRVQKCGDTTTITWPRIDFQGTGTTLYFTGLPSSECGTSEDWQYFVCQVINDTEGSPVNVPGGVRVQPSTGTIEFSRYSQAVLYFTTFTATGNAILAGSLVLRNK